jgi:hypothetical protein
METTKNYLKMKVMMAVSFILFSLQSFSKEADSLAKAAVPENEKLFEILNYVAMGVGTIAVIWIAYYLSNRGGDKQTPTTRTKVSKLRMRIR